MKHQFDVKFAARKYQTADGQEKTYWSKHGTVWIESDEPINIKSFTIKLDSIPQSANWEGFLKAFPHEAHANKITNRGFPPDDYEDVPF